jgi:hypothetical protein
LYREGKKSNMVLSRIQKLESLGFEWNCYDVAWEERLSELADYRKIHGHCNVPQSKSKNTQLATWVGTQRQQYRLRKEGNKSDMTLPHIQELESLGFEWDSRGGTWECRLSELADYRKMHGHCNVPNRYRENTKLATWVRKQRRQYNLHLEGKESHISLSRIQALESLGFEWSNGYATSWEARLSELADYRKIHGHCNVPTRYSKNPKLGTWVTNQRSHYRLHLKGETSSMTPFRIQALENLGFEWKSTIIWGKGTRKISPILARR